MIGKKLLTVVIVITLLMSLVLTSCPTRGDGEGVGVGTAIRRYTPIPISELAHIAGRGTGHSAGWLVYCDGIWCQRDDTPYLTHIVEQRTRVVNGVEETYLQHVNHRGEAITMFRRFTLEEAQALGMGPGYPFNFPLNTFFFEDGRPVEFPGLRLFGIDRDVLNRRMRDWSDYDGVAWQVRFNTTHIETMFLDCLFNWGISIDPEMRAAHNHQLGVSNACPDLGWLEIVMSFHRLSRWGIPNRDPRLPCNDTSNFNQNTVRGWRTDGRTMSSYWPDRIWCQYCYDHTYALWGEGITETTAPPAIWLEIVNFRLFVYE